MTQSHNHLVIMAGGVGSRFWPMSTVECPKQFIDILGVGRTLLQMTYDRFNGICPPENVWVVTNSKYAALVSEQLPELQSDHVLLEPCRRNTAPCIAYVSWRIKMADARANVVVSPSDHVVTDTAEFQRVIRECMSFTSETDAMVTLGMKPTRPETGYGYIQADLTSSALRHKEIYRVDSFHEKPDIETAKSYIADNDFFWNSGIFIWSVETIVNALRVYAPRINSIFEGMKDLMGTPQEQAVINEVYGDCENISIDYAVMEKAEEIFVCPANFGWSDLGTWGALLMQTKRDIYGNSCIGPNVKVFDSRNCIVHATQEKKVIVQGLDGYIIAEHNDTLLVCKLSEEQRIRQFSEE